MTNEELIKNLEEYDKEVNRLYKENKRLKDRYERCKKQKIKVENACSNYKYKIDKAIEYIEERFEYNEETGEYTLKATFDKCSVYELYKILKRGIIWK